MRARQSEVDIILRRIAKAGPVGQDARRIVRRGERHHEIANPGMAEIEINLDMVDVEAGGKCNRVGNRGVVGNHKRRCGAGAEHGQICLRARLVPTLS